MSSVNCEQTTDLRLSIPIEEAKVDLCSSLGEMIEDRTLVNAIAAPCASQAEYQHSP